MRHETEKAKRSAEYWHPAFGESFLWLDVAIGMQGVNSPQSEQMVMQQTDRYDGMYDSTLLVEDPANQGAKHDRSQTRRAAWVFLALPKLLTRSRARETWID